MAEPACSTDLTISSVYFRNSETPLGLTRESLVNYDKETQSLKLLNQRNLQLLGKEFVVDLIAFTESSSTLSASLSLVVTYGSSGPEFVAPLEIPPITCTDADKDWKIILPLVKSEDQ